MPSSVHAVAAAVCCALAHASFLQRDVTPGTPDIDAALKDRTLENFKAWVAKTENPTLVVIGDSTMILLSKAMREMFAEYEEKSGAHMFPAEAQTLLADASCPHTIDGVYTSQFGGPLGLTMHRIGLHSKLPDDTGCFDPCLAKAVAALSPGAVVWNFGLHLMHIYPLRQCVAKPDALNYHNCGSYGDLVSQSASMLKEVAPQLVWRTTNAICEEKYDLKTQSLLNEWHDAARGAELEEQCQQACDLGGGRKCADELGDARGAELERQWSVDALAAISTDIKVLDAFAMTDGRCDMTQDGEHYAPLSYDEVDKLAEILLQG